MSNEQSSRIYVVRCLMLAADAQTAVIGYPCEHQHTSCDAARDCYERRRREALRMGFAVGEPDQLIGVAHVAWLCDVTARCARNWFHAGKLGSKIGPGSYAVSLREAVTFAETPRRGRGWLKGKKRNTAGA